MSPSGFDEAGYRALRTGLGAYRPARDVVWVHGPEAAGYLQGQCSQDVVALAPGDAADALLLAPDGKLSALVRVTRLGPDSFLLDVDGGFGEVVVTRMARFRLRAKLDIDPLDWACLALRGDGVPDPLGTPGGPGDGHRPPAAADAPADDRSEGPTPPGPLPVRWGDWSGVDVLGPAPGPEPPPGARWCDEGAWEAARVESGVPVMGRELDERTIAAEAGLVERTVSFTKGCFTGQELVARLDARGNRVSRRLCGVVAEEGAGPGLAGAVLFAPEGGEDAPERGRVTSAAWSVALGAPVGLAYAHRSLPVPGPVELAGPDGARRRAELRDLPLA